MIKVGRIVNTIGPADNGLYGAHIVTVALTSPAVEVTAYAKALDTIPFLVEILCAQLALELNIPVPEPIIAFNEKGDRALFASLKVDYPDLSRRLTIANDQVVQNTANEAVFKKISQWSDIEIASVFDEWIANEDRNIGNILFDGKDIIYLIDHNLAMRPHFSPITPLSNNTLLNIKLLFNHDELSRQRIKNKISAISSNLDDTLPEKLIDQIRSDLNLIKSSELDIMLKFLQTRLNVLGKITTNKVPVNQLSL